MKRGAAGAMWASAAHPSQGGRSVRAAVDVMGGDKAPAAILQGCWEAAPLLDENDLVYLVGCEQTIGQGLSASNLSVDQKSRYKLVPTTQIIEMDESPVEAIRAKPKSSINV